MGVFNVIDKKIYNLNSRGNGTCISCAMACTNVFSVAETSPSIFTIYSTPSNIRSATPGLTASIACIDLMKRL